MSGDPDKATGIDWEDMFENERTGLVGAVQRASSVDAIRSVADDIVSSLFARADDRPRREALARLLDEITVIPPDSDAHDPLDVVRVRTVKLLRGIKRDRVARAARARAVGDAGAGGLGDRRADEPEILDDAMQGGALLAPTAGAVEGKGLSLPEAFCGVFRNALWDRFAVLRGDLDSKAQIKGRLPFLLSRAFAERYVRLVGRHVLPSVYVRCRGSIRQLDGEDPGTWSTLIRDSFTDAADRLMLWDAWQSVWLEKTTQARGGGDDARRENAAALDLWSEFTAFADTFHAPLDEDNQLLMDMFGRSVGGLSEQISALLEIATRDASASKLFDAYQRGKSIDVPLLAASYQYPAVFLTGDRPMLEEMVRNFGRRQKLEVLPLTSRYLGDRM